MSCTIELKDKTILETSVGVFESLFHEFNNLKEKENLQINKEFELFMEKIDNAIFTLGGVCIDIEKIFHNSNNLELVIFLLEITINKIKYELRDRAIENLWKFHGELVKYKEELEALDK